MPAVFARGWPKALHGLRDRGKKVVSELRESYASIQSIPNQTVVMYVSPRVLVRLMYKEADPEIQSQGAPTHAPPPEQARPFDDHRAAQAEHARWAREP